MSTSCSRARQVEHDLHQEAVELRLGQRVGALVLDRVLRRGDEERVGQRPRDAVDRDLALLHRLQQRALRLRRRAVDLVREQQVREHRPGPEVELAGARVEHGRAAHVARHQVGRELHALRVERQGGGQRAHQQRLRDAGHALEQHVAAREQRDDQAADGRLLADDGLAHLRTDSGEAFTKVVGHRVSVDRGSRGHRGVGMAPPGTAAARTAASSRARSSEMRTRSASVAGLGGEQDPRRPARAVGRVSRAAATTTSSTEAVRDRPRFGRDPPDRADPQRVGGVEAGPAAVVEARAPLHRLAGPHDDGQRLDDDRPEAAALPERGGEPGEQQQDRRAGVTHGGVRSCSVRAAVRGDVERRLLEPDEVPRGAERAERDRGVAGGGDVLVRERGAVGEQQHLRAVVRAGDQLRGAGGGGEAGGGGGGPQAELDALERHRAGPPRERQVARGRRGRAARDARGLHVRQHRVERGAVRREDHDAGAPGEQPSSTTSRRSSRRCRRRAACRRPRRCPRPSR